jgi:HK97 family phage major capsid protein
MKKINPTRLRGIAAVRAETPDITATLTELNRTFAAFREQNDRRLGDLERGREDVVTNEHVDRINASVTELTNLVNSQRETLDALRLNGAGGGDGLTAQAREHATAFNAWFRRGDMPEATLRDLQVRAALTSQSDPDGGFVVPEEMDSAISRVLATVSAMRAIARVVSTGSRDYSLLVNKGGSTASWVGEEDSRATTSTPNLSEITIEAMELSANPGITQRLLDDASFDVAAWLADEVSITFAEAEGAAFISGDGNKKPRGFLSYSTVANASYAWGSLGFIATGAAADFAASNPVDNLIDLMMAAKAGYRNNGSFITADATVAKIRKFKDTTGQLLWAPPTADLPQSILGKPVVTDDNMPVAGAGNFLMAFGDFRRGYTITDRTGARVTRDPYTNKPYVQFYTTKRVGGGVSNYEAIKLLKCST